ncbi:MAG: sugar phosphate isomerase/epimerase [Candidatus Latescibacteria bacterium]|nr:sugar phosphate isomerase/epimerase [Candidatus Latescibacterota bacterium]
MQLSLSASLCPALRLPEFLHLAKEAGYSAVELDRTGSESSPAHPDFSVRRVREHVQAAGLRLSGLKIRPLTGRKADSDERNLGYNLRQLEWDIHLARALGLRTANLCGGARTEEARADLRAGVQQLLRRIPDISLNLGSAPGTPVQGLADYQALVPCLDPRARVLLDTGTLLGTGEDPLRVTQVFGRRLGLVHLRDGRGAEPLPFGQGDLDCDGLLRHLQQVEYLGVLVVELAPSEKPLEAARQARQYLERMRSC